MAKASSVKLSGRLNYLDSLRGIAALIVVFSHFAWMSPDQVMNSIQGIGQALHSPTNFALYLLVKINMAARSAVILFFVLSGFVLTFSLENKKFSFLEYVIKRIFRIYPALLVAIILSYLMHMLIGSHQEFSSSWLQGVSAPDMSFDTLLKNLLLLGTKDGNAFDGVIWSLVYELRISLIFPLILWSIKEYKMKAIFAWFCMSIFSSFIVRYITGNYIDGYQEANFWLTLFDTIYFIVFFAAGSWLAINKTVVSKNIKHLPPFLLIFFIMLILYSLLKSGSEGIFVIDSDYIRCIGASGLITLAISFNKFEKALNFRFPIWTGRISYSLYLIHMPIIYVVSQCAVSAMSLIYIDIIVLLLSLAVAQIMANLVEFPMNDFRKFLSKTISR